MLVDACAQVLIVQDKVLNPKKVNVVDSQRRDGRETGGMMYARGKDQPWANLLPTTKPISLLSGFAKDEGPNFYQQYNESGDMMGWTKRLWEETTYSMVSLQVRMATLQLCGLCVLNMTVQGSARAKIGVFELTVVAQEPFGPNFRAEEKGSVYLSPIFTGGSFFVTARDRFGNLAACGKTLTVDIRWFCSVVLSPFCSRSLIVLRRWP